MKIVIAPDSYKESMSAEEVAQYVETGFRQVFPFAEYLKVPMADGGEGSLEAIKASINGRDISLTVKDAYSRDIEASYLFDEHNQTALIEIAKICGLELTNPNDRTPAIATTFGVGQAINDALDKGVKKIILFIGGSATNDAGAGLFQALGGHLLDNKGNELDPGCEALFRLAKIDNSEFDSRVFDVRFEVACDVDNQLLGEQGATYVFGPQKGVKPDQLELFDHCLRTLAEVIDRDLNKNAFDLIGGGAAGGLGAGLSVFCNAELRNGFDIISDVVGLRSHIKDADLVITGEGRIDSQSARGKVPSGVGNLAFEYSVPVIGIAGSLAHDVDELYQQGVTAVFSITNTPMTLDEAYKNSKQNLINTCKNIALIIKSSPLVS